MNKRPDALDVLARALMPPKNDYPTADEVSVTIEHDKLWVDVNGFNVFRAYRIKTLQVDDRRMFVRGEPWPQNDEEVS